MIKSVTALPVLAGLLLGARCLCAQAMVALPTGAPRPSHKVTIEIDDGKIVGDSKTLLTIQVCPEPPMRRGGPIHDQAHAALRDLQMSYARLQPWFPYPRLSIAELEPPRDGKTSWDFSLIDPVVEDFYAAAEGRPIVLNVAIPRWLFKSSPHHYPDDPNEIDWLYELGPDAGTEMNDPSFKEAADYFRRVAEWYVRGGFVDEYGKEHHSGHHLKIDYWEVLNEQDEGMAHSLDPQTYTALYDAVVSELRKVDPAMKFSGLALADATSLNYFEYFLNPKNHEPDIPVDMVSYHKYLTAETGKTLPEWQKGMFEEADRFLQSVEKIERVRKRLSPHTLTFISELGLIWGEDFDNSLAILRGGKTSFAPPRIPPEYWTLGASAIAYEYLGVVREGVDMVAAAELVDYPGQMAGMNLIHWETGEPNAVYRVVKLLHEELPPGAKLLQTSVHGSGIEAQAFLASGNKKLLLINKTLKSLEVKMTSRGAARTSTVDITTKSAPPRQGEWNGGTMVLKPHAVTMVSWGATRG